jgi:hypothetical protein
VKLAPELEAIATAACEQLRAKTDGDPQREERLQRALAMQPAARSPPGCH